MYYTLLEPANKYCFLYFPSTQIHFGWICDRKKYNNNKTIYIVLVGGEQKIRRIWHHITINVRINGNISCCCCCWCCWFDLQIMIYMNKCIREFFTFLLSFTNVVCIPSLFWFADIRHCSEWNIFRAYCYPYLVKPQYHNRWNTRDWNRMNYTQL